MKRPPYSLLLFLILPVAVRAAGKGEPCIIEVRSSQSKQGTLQGSQIIPRVPTNGQPLRCTVIFMGEGSEKVSVRFPHFNLHTRPRFNATDCQEQDRVKVLILLHDQLSSITKDGWCGRDTPPQLMSPSGVMQLQYTIQSRPQSETLASFGFAVEYTFHKDWRMEEMGAETSPSAPCLFLIHSSTNTSGALWSVNYPGFYPRSTKCEYVFYGNTPNSKEVVSIYFDYFDVEGMEQCGVASESDYVLFSNYQTHDRTNRKFCGKVPPRSPITSESNYFRLIFESNGVFDGTGFHARYQFLTPVRPSMSRVKTLQSSVAAEWRLSTMAVALALLLQRM